MVLTVLAASVGITNHTTRNQVVKIISVITIQAISYFHSSTKCNNKNYFILVNNQFQFVINRSNLANFHTWKYFLQTTFHYLQRLFSKMYRFMRVFWYSWKKQAHNLVDLPKVIRLTKRVESKFIQSIFTLMMKNWTSIFKYDFRIWNNHWLYISMIHHIQFNNAWVI